MTIRLHFEVKAVCPNADFHSKFLIICASEVSTFLLKELERIVGTAFPEGTIAEICTEDGSVLFLYVDSEGICFIDKAALNYCGEKILPVVDEEFRIVMKEFTL